MLALCFSPHTPSSHLALHMTKFRGILGEETLTPTLYSICFPGQTNFKQKLEGFFGGRMRRGGVT